MGNWSPTGIILVVIAIAAVAYSLGKGHDESGRAWKTRGWPPNPVGAAYQWREYVCDGEVISSERY